MPEISTVMKRFSQLLALNSFAICQPILDLINVNHTFLTAHQVETFELLALVFAITFLVPLALLSLELVISLVYRDIVPFVHNLFIFILLAFIIAPLLNKQGLPQATVVLALTLILALLLTVIIAKSVNLQNLLSFLSLSVIFFLAVFFYEPSNYSYIYHYSSDDRKMSTPVKAESTPDIIFVVLDEFSSVILCNENDEIDPELFPNLSKLAESAIWYRNHTSTHDYTKGALQALLTGRADDSPLKPSLNNIRKNNIFLLLARAGYELQVTEAATHMCPSSLNMGMVPAVGKGLQTLVKDTAIVWAHTIVHPGFSGILPSLGARWAGFGTASEPSKFTSDVRESWPSKGRASRFLRFCASITKKPRPVLYFFHSMLPHVPYDYSSKGYYYSMAPLSKFPIWKGIPGLIDGTKENWRDDWTPPLMAFQRYILQTQFLDHLIGELIKRLKNEEMYENSLLIIVSDHGASYVKGEPRRRLNDKNYPEIMATPLLIKPPGWKTGLISDCNSESIDIAPTILDILGVEPYWKPEGSSLLSESRPNRKTKTIRTEDQRIKSITVSSDFKDRFKAVQSKRSIIDVRRGYPYVSLAPYHKDLIGKSITKFNTRPSIFKGLIYVKEKIELSDSGNMEFPLVIAGEVHTAGSLSPPFDVAVCVNQRIWAITKTFEISKKNVFYSMIPESAYKMGANTISIFAVEYELDGPEFIGPIKDFYE